MALGCTCISNLRQRDQIRVQQLLVALLPAYMTLKKHGYSNATSRQAS